MKGRKLVLLRRWSLFLVVLCMLALIVAPDVAAQRRDPNTITWWITPWRIRVPGMPDDATPTGEEFARYMSEKFMELHPGVRVEYEVVTHQGRLEKATAALFAGNPPDVYWEQGSPNLVWIENGLLEPINDYLTPADFEDFMPGTLETGKVGDNYYMWPWNYSNNGMGVTLLLNPAIFEERGVPLPPLPERSWTIDEFLQAAEQLTFDRDGDGETDVYAIVIAGQDQLNVLAWLHRFGARLLNDEGTEFIINNPEGVRALQFMVDLIYKYEVAPKGAAGMGVYDAIDLFHQGRVAMGYGGIYEIGRIDRAYRAGQLAEPFEVVVAQFPHDPEVGPVSYRVNGGFVVFRQPNAERRDLVMEFARFLTNTENAALLEDLLYFSSRKSANEQMTFEQVQAYTDVNEQVQVYLRATEYGIPYYGPAHVDVSEAIPHLMAAVQAALSRDKTPQQALDDFVREANRIVFGRR